MISNSVLRPAVQKAHIGIVKLLSDANFINYEKVKKNKPLTKTLLKRGTATIPLLCLFH